MAGQCTPGTDVGSLPSHLANRAIIHQKALAFRLQFNALVTFKSVGFVDF
jgi:hypothetical protein